MKGIVATFNRDTDGWSFSSDYDISNVPVYIGVVGETEWMLSCRLGFTAVQDGDTIGEYSFPPSGQTLIGSDQSYIGYSSVDIPSDSDVQFTFFFEDEAGTHDGLFTLVPKTTPKPDDGKEYVWRYDHWEEVV